MDDAWDDASEPDLVLAVVPAVRRRHPWPPVEVPSAPVVDTVAEPSATRAEDVPGIAAADGDVPAGRLDRRWWISTLVSTVVHVVLLTILALVVTNPDPVRRPRPLEIVQPASEPEAVEFQEPEDLAAVVIEPPDPVVDPVAVPEAADVAADAADAGAMAFDEVEAVGVAEFDLDGLAARIGGGAGADGAGGGAAGGFGGDIGRRLKASGAKTGDVQVSLSWDNFNDIDLHVVAPSGERICFSHRASRCRGLLDVDMNALGPQSREPVENVFWPAKRAPPGEYRVFVHHYWRFDPDEDDTTFTVHVLVNGRKEKFMGSVKSGDPPLLVAAFRRAAGDEAADEFLE